MKIYVVESFFDGYVFQYGFSDRKEIAEQKANEFEKRNNKTAWVTEYTLGKNRYTQFECD